MAAGRLLVPGWSRALDSDGDPISARISLFNTGTDALASIYSDEALTVPLQNPVLSNSAGRFPAIWASDAVTYDWSVEAPYGPPGSPFTGTGLTTALAADVLAADAAEAAADAAALSATDAASSEATSQAILDDINNIILTSGTVAGLAGRLLLNGSNIGANGPAFRTATGTVGSTALAAGTGGTLVGLQQTGTGSVVQALQAYADKQGLTPEGFGAVGNGVTNDHAALNRVAARINALSGGVVNLSGDYVWGVQTQAPNASSGYAFRGTSAMKFENCTKPIIINANGATLRTAAGMKFGAFNPTTGLPFASTPPFTDPNYRAYIGWAFEFVNCTGGVYILGFPDLFGNAANITLGGQWGDTGYQQDHDGFAFTSCSEVYCEFGEVSGFGRDAGQIAYPSLALSAGPKPHYIRILKSVGCCRNGISIVGGNGVVIEADIRDVGKGAFASAPNNAIDFEPEAGAVIANVELRNPYFYNCNSAAVADVGSGTIQNIRITGGTIIGTTSAPLFNFYSRWDVEGTVLVGATQQVYGNTDPSLASQFTNCAFRMDPAYSPSGTVFGTRNDFSNGENVRFTNCDFTAKGSRRVPVSAVAKKPLYEGCFFSQAGTDQVDLQGVFTGRNVITAAGATWNKSTSLLFGPTYFNGTEPGSTPFTMKDRIKLFANDSGSGRVVDVASCYDPVAYYNAYGPPAGGPALTRGTVVFSTNSGEGGPLFWMLDGGVSGASDGHWIRGPASVKQNWTYTTGFTQTRAFNYSTATLADVSATLATLIQDLRDYNVLRKP